MPEHVKKNRIEYRAYCKGRMRQRANISKRNELNRKRVPCNASPYKLWLFFLSFFSNFFFVFLFPLYFVSHPFFSRFYLFFYYCRFHFEVVDCIFITHSSHSSRIFQNQKNESILFPFSFFVVFFSSSYSFCFFFFCIRKAIMNTHSRQVTTLYFQFYSNDFYSDAISYFFHHKVCPVCAWYGLLSLALPCAILPISAL